MPRVLTVLCLLAAGLCTAAPAQPSAKPPKGEVIKVLPQLIDLQGHTTVSPSLFDRDAYQAYLAKHPEKVSGIRYCVLWKAKEAADEQLIVRIELLGLYEEKLPRSKTLEITLDGRASLRRWTNLELTGEDYVQFGKITAWRATLWCNGEMLDEYKSFLW
ncbi:MAG: hypothetical protein MUC91_07220 [Verrucomicrobia bacterium]|nr:hypothetical protein [Verrucomicrobiota bacterium]